jgi:glucose-1-phosphate cytidylyltransferase
MKTVIFAGGYGSRIVDVTKNLPKPLLNIGGRPMISHLIEIFKNQGMKDFLILTGYKSSDIKNYFYSNRKRRLYKDLKIDCVFTGVNTKTGKRLSLVSKMLKDDNFFLTYSDGLSNINLKNLLKFHKKHKKLATVTAVRPPARFGELSIFRNKVTLFEEKPQLQKGWINGGFFILKKEFLKFVSKKNIMFEREPIINATKVDQLMAYKHHGFWQCIDTKRDYDNLKKLIRTKKYLWLKK